MGVTLRLTSMDVERRPPAADERWRRVCTHTHMMRGALRPPESHRALIRWCRTMKADAVGVGSPWTPVNEGTYLRYEGVDTCTTPESWTRSRCGRRRRYTVSSRS